MLRDIRLLEDDRLFRIEPGAEPVDQHFANIIPEIRGILVAGSKGVPVGDKIEALVAVLQANPVCKAPM